MSDVTTRDASFDLGRLQGRMDGLETRFAAHEAFVLKMDGKLDLIQASVDKAVGAREKIASLIKFASFTAGAVGAMAALIGWLMRHVPSVWNN